MMHGRPPEDIDVQFIQQALVAAGWDSPDLVIDARCFRPPRRRVMGEHTGMSVTLTKQLLDHTEVFQKHWKDALRGMQEEHEETGGSTPINIAIYCRAGEKRSVSFAWLLSESLKRHTDWKETEPIQHLCRRFWGRKTCAGLHCAECNISSDAHQDLIASMEGLMVFD